MLLYITIGVYAIYWYIEVLHDDILRKKENSIRKLYSIVHKLDPLYKVDIKKENALTSKWHSLDWKGHALLALLVSFIISASYLYIPVYAILIGALRVLILNIGGNIISDRKLLYVGTRGLESKFKGKEVLYYIIILLIFISSFYVVL